MNIYVTDNFGSYERTVSVDFDSNNANDVSFAKSILEIDARNNVENTKAINNFESEIQRIQNMTAKEYAETIVGYRGWDSVYYVPTRISKKTFSTLEEAVDTAIKWLLQEVPPNA